MSDTRRKHLPPGKRARRGPIRADERPIRALRKDPKQRRVNERVKLRKEYM